MSFFKTVVPAMLAGALLYSPAVALPGSASSKNLTSAMDSPVIQVAQEQKKVVKKQVVVKKPVQKKVVVNKKVVVHKTVVYRPGYRYSVAPVGWRIYGPGRPYYWQTYGCILVGNVWWCP